MRDVLRRWLQRRGWEVDEASNGSLAIERLRPQCDAADTPAYDLIICDLRMPSLSGPELYAWAMINRPDVIGRLVFASGDVCDAGAADFLGRTGCPVLEKPFELRTLDDLVSRIAVSG